MIINSLLDTDFYKLTMQQAVLHQFPDTIIRYDFKCRNKDVVFTFKQFERIVNEVNHLCSLTFTKDELDYLSSIRFIKKDYVDFLRNFKLNLDHIHLGLDDNGTLQIYAEGNWFLTILFEIPILSIVNQVYFEDKVADLSAAEKALNDKLNLVRKIDGFKFSDFGGRRRFSFDWHDSVILNTISGTAGSSVFTGTSNVYFAKKYGITPIGTMAHELIMAGQGLNVTLRDSQRRMLQAWVDEYRGDLGYALTDTLGVDAFLRDFDLYFSKLYDGVRHDSGDPFVWGDKMIAHYNKLRIDPMSKQLIFSDGLNFPRAVEIFNYFKGKAKVSFGIGTNLTNDIPGLTPLNIVMKATKVNGKPVAKISDSPGKGMCHNDCYLAYLKQVFEIE